MNIVDVLMKKHTQPQILSGGPNSLSQWEIKVSIIPDPNNLDKDGNVIRQTISLNIKELHEWCGRF